MESKSEKWQLKRIGTMSFINDECDNVKQSDKSFFLNIIKNIFLEVIADFKELEGTIENMKAISFPKEEVVNGITSVDYPSDNETEINVFIPIEINYWKGKSTHIYRKSFSTIEECQAFFDNMHKEDSGERWGTMLCDYRTAKWEYKENGDLLMMVNHDGAIVEYICMNCGRKIKK